MDAIQSTQAAASDTRDGGVLVWLRSLLLRWLGVELESEGGAVSARGKCPAASTRPFPSRGPS